MATVAGDINADNARLDELEASFRGEVVRPTSASYDEHRAVWNGSIDKRPAVIARCAGVADVTSAVRFAKETGLLTAVRSGQHSFPGHSACDDGIIIDLGLMKGVRVDPDTRTVRVQSGVLLGELDHETQAFGMAVPAGIVTHTGVAGLTLGGGLGWLTRKFGMTIDQLRSADVVTAAGEFVKASEDRNTELFWGVRGGGGNFGIVTEFEFNLNPVGPIVLAGPIFWHMKDAPEVLRFYRDWADEAPDDLMTIVACRLAPNLPVVPPDLVGKPVVGIICCYAGPIEEGEKVVAPMKAFGSPALDLCSPKPFVAHQALLDPGFRRGCWYYVRACDVAELTDDVIDITVDHCSRITSPITSIALWQRGGAAARIGEDDTAFGGRDAGFTFNINGNTETAAGFDEQRAWVRDFWTALKPHHHGAYVNFMNDEGIDAIKRTYGAAKFERLRALKRTYDPDNLFRLNQNIPPT